MAPCSDYLPPLDLSCYGIPASNWDRGILKEICEGCPSSGSVQCRTRLPLIPAGSGSCASMCSSPVESCNQREPIRLPSITSCNNGRICGNHPRDDCCLVPRCYTGTPACPIGFCVERTYPIKPNNVYEPPCQPFDGCSLYRSQFRGCQGPPAESFKPSSNVDAACGRMADTTVYRENYTCKPICLERPQIKNEYSPTCAPFEGVSTYRVSYRGCLGSPAESVKPRSTFEGPCAKMDGTTTYRSNYIPYCSAEVDYARGKLLKPSQESDFSCSPFNGCSTYRMEFVPKCCSRAQSMKPNSTTGFASAPLSGRTTYRNDYLPFYFKDCCPDPCLPRECCMPRCC